MSIIFEARNDDDTQQTHINFEDSIAVLNNEVGTYILICPIVYRRRRIGRTYIFCLN